MKWKGLWTLLTFSLSFLLVVTSFLLATNPQTTYARELEVVGEEIGLVVEPASTGLFELQNMCPGDREEGSFRLSNSYQYPFDLYLRAEPIVPDGDIVPNNVNLGEILKLQVTYKAQNIFNGSLHDFAIEAINLGRFQPGDVQNLKALVYLPGPETGNEFQGQKIQIKWIFTAQSTQKGGGGESEDNGGGSGDNGGESTPNELEEKIPAEPIPEGTPVVPVEPPGEIEIIPEEIPQGQPEMPKAGEDLPILFYLVGFVVLAAGLKLVYSKKS